MRVSDHKWRIQGMLSSQFHTHKECVESKLVFSNITLLSAKAVLCENEMNLGHRRWRFSLKYSLLSSSAPLRQFLAH
uniref:MATH domain-containing protein n=1 Tax=Ascaris lumbricoides TaxID=6252 RepID=A0A9J2PJR1_ASCLU